MKIEHEIEHENKTWNKTWKYTMIIDHTNYFILIKRTWSYLQLSLNLWPEWNFVLLQIEKLIKWAKHDSTNNLLLNMNQTEFDLVHDHLLGQEKSIWHYCQEWISRFPCCNRGSHVAYRGFHVAIPRFHSLFRNIIKFQSM